MINLKEKIIIGILVVFILLLNTAALIAGSDKKSSTENREQIKEQTTDHDKRIQDIKRNLERYRQIQRKLDKKKALQPPKK